MTQPDLHNIPQPSGYIHDLVKLLQSRMGFNYNYIVAPLDASYDQLVDCVENGTYEVVMADLSITSSRTDKIDFSYPFYDNTLRLVVLKSKTTTISPFAFLKPFTRDLWLLIIFVIYFCSALLIGLYEFYGQNERQIAELSGNIHHGNGIITIMRSMYQAIGALLQRGSELQPRTFFGRFQTAVIWMMSIILVALLTSNLTTYLNAQRAKPWLQSIEDLRMCRKVDCNRIGIVEGSQHEEYFRKEVMNGYQMNYYYLKHPDECYTKLLDHHIDVAVADSSSADYFTQTPAYCQLEIADISFSKTYFGIALPKDWRYKQDLDNHIIDLKINGEIDRLVAKWFKQNTCDHENGNENNGLGDGLTMLEASGLFYIFGVLTIVNVFAFILKKLYSLYKKRDSECDATPANEQNQIPLMPIGNLDTASSAHQNSSTHTSSTENRNLTYF
jgi:ABC-type amino acid transport substrate-binding protein